MINIIKMKAHTSCKDTCYTPPNARQWLEIFSTRWRERLARAFFGDVKHERDTCTMIKILIIKPLNPIV